MSAKRTAFGWQLWRLCISPILRTTTHSHKTSWRRESDSIILREYLKQTYFGHSRICFLFIANRQESVGASAMYFSNMYCCHTLTIVTLVPGLALDALTSFWSNSCVYFSRVSYIQFVFYVMVASFFCACLWCLFGRPNWIKPKRQCAVAKKKASNTLRWWTRKNKNKTHTRKLISGWQTYQHRAKQTVCNVYFCCFNWNVVDFSR